MVGVGSVGLVVSWSFRPSHVPFMQRGDHCGVLVPVHVGGEGDEGLGCGIPGSVRALAGVW